MNEQLPPLTAEQKSTLTSLSGIRDEVKTLVQATLDWNEKLPPDKSYYALALERLQETRNAYNILVKDKRGDEMAPHFDALFAYFIERQKEKPGEGTFQLYDLHDKTVREFKNPHFHEDLMGHFLQKEDEARATGNVDALNMAMLAKEFDANGLRRRGFHMLKGDANSSVGSDMVKHAQEVFAEVLAYWEEVNDLKSQGRVLYEQAHIATETGDFATGAEVQRKSALLAEKANDLTGACIARIKECEALLKGKLEDPAVLTTRLIEQRDAIIAQAALDDTTAKNWVGNAHAHLAEAQEAAGDIPAALASWQATADDPVIANEESMRELKDAAAAEIARLGSNS